MSARTAAATVVIMRCGTWKCNLRPLAKRTSSWCCLLMKAREHSKSTAYSKSIPEATRFGAASGMFPSSCWIVLENGMRFVLWCNRCSCQQNFRTLYCCAEIFVFCVWWMLDCVGAFCKMRSQHAVLILGIGDSPQQAKSVQVLPEHCLLLRNKISMAFFNNWDKGCNSLAIAKSPRKVIWCNLMKTKCLTQIRNQAVFFAPANLACGS